MNTIPPLKALGLAALVTICFFPASVVTAADEKENVARTTAPAKASSADEKFMREASQGSLYEVRLGQLATGKAARQDVKEFGAQMITDHGKAGEELAPIAAKNGLILAGDLDSKHQGKLDKMSKLSGEEFDRAYVSDMVKDHEEDVADFEKEAQRAEDPDLKKFATKTLAVVRTHLEKIKAIAAAQK